MRSLVLISLTLSASLAQSPFWFFNSSPSIPFQPAAGQRCAGRNFPGGKRCCSPEQPCGEGEGDCDGPGDGGQHDGHAGCKGDLVCGSNNCRQFGRFYHERDDCCEKPSKQDTELVNTFVPDTPLTPPPGCTGWSSGGPRQCQCFRTKM